jgi:hypothetical protein
MLGIHRVRRLRQDKGKEEIRGGDFRFQISDWKLSAIGSQLSEKN